MKIKDSKIVVTGGGNGLGRALVLKLLNLGAVVIAIDISASALEETTALAGPLSGNLYSRVLDITDRVAVEKFATEMTDRFGGMDGLINNAGIIQPFMRVNELDYKTIDRVFNVDFFGTLYMTKALLPQLLARKEASIVNISSMGGMFPVPGQTIYGAAKSAVKLFTEGLQSELEQTGVQVTLICPGAIETDIKFNSGAEKERMHNNEAASALIRPVKPSIAAEMVIQAMEKNSRKVLIGTDIKLLNFINNLNQKLVRTLINRQMKAHIPQQ